MNKLISVLALTVIVLPLTISVLFQGPDNLLDSVNLFFSRLLEEANRFGTV